MSYDVVIRGGEVIDGSGAEARRADVAIEGGVIREVGRVSGSAEREVDASGLLVTPGFVDVHTHYDGQATWDTDLAPSSWHGVTTAVMGNCGVGFAPAAPDKHEWLIGLMEGVEDIPGTALAEGIRWEWESFPEYLDALSRRRFTIDVGAQLPHGALRAYVMGERGADHTVTPSEDEIASMAEHARRSMEAGAIGFTTSRTQNHRAKDGSFTPSLTATREELIGIARGLAEAGKGVFEIVSDFRDVEAEFALMREMVEASGRPMSISVAQADRRPDQWRVILNHIAQAREDGLAMAAQVAVRPIGFMLGLQASLHPFITAPAFREIAELPFEERVAALRDPERRRRILAEHAGEPARFVGYERMYILGDPPDYEQDPSQSLAARGEREGRAPAELAYDALLADGGRALLYSPFLNYTDGHLESTREMLLDANTVPGLGDAGAHCGMICDGSFPTYLLTHWGRDRTRGERLPLEWLVKRHTADTAALVGLNDRGRLAPGLRADLNVIDFDALALEHPRIVHDLPAGGRRLVQGARGYRQTWVAGELTYADGKPTGALPGRLVRGAQSAS